jgi:SAM-dependent methyltransferase
MIDPDTVQSEIRRCADRFEVLPDIHRNDFIFQFLASHPAFASIEEAIGRYFDTGQRSAHRFDELVSRCYPPHEGRLDVLEFASGYGCVSRHLKKLNVRYNCVACDIHQTAVDFLQNHLEVPAILSASDPNRFSTSQRFAVVFALSFFSHIPRPTWARWFEKLLGLVADDGLLIFTTHGRRSGRFFGNPVLDDDGFWFRPESEQKDLSPQEYGSTIVAPRYVFSHFAPITDAHLVFFEEGLWYRHQDTYIVQRSGGQQ